MVSGGYSLETRPRLPRYFPKLPYNLLLSTLLKMYYPSTIRWVKFICLYSESFVSMICHLVNVQGQRDSALARDINSLEHLLVGSVAGLLACSATYPLDTMRTQMSVTGGLKGSLLSVGSQIISTQGFPALYKGFSATLTSDMLGSGLGFMNYEVTWVACIE